MTTATRRTPQTASETTSRPATAPRRATRRASRAGVDAPDDEKVDVVTEIQALLGDRTGSVARVAPIDADAVAALVQEFNDLAAGGVARPASDDPSIPAVWGPAPTPAERAEAEMANLVKAFVARRAVIDASVSRADVADLLGVSEQSVTKQILGDRIVGVKDKGRWAIPSWQLDAGSEDGLLPGIRQLARVFPGGPVALSLWMLRPNVEFGDERPRDVLAANRVDEVIQVVKGLTAAGW